MRRRPVQQELSFRTWGGARKGAGRKRVGRPSVPHVARSAVSRHEPLIVTLRAGLRVLREQVVFSALRDAIRLASKASFRVVEFSVQDDHAHLICEASDEVALARGVAGLAIRMARAANRVMRRSGRFWSSRYHARALKSPVEVRNALVYVLHNRKHHGPLGSTVDAMSSAPWFAGWAEAETVDTHLRSLRAQTGPPTHPPRTWLLTVGWKTRGLLSVHSAPA